MEISGKLKLYLNNAVQGVRMEAFPDELGLTNMMRVVNGTHYSCVLTNLFKDEQTEVSFRFRSAEWNSGKSITVEIENLEKFEPRIRVGEIRDNHDWLYICGKGNDKYEVEVRKEALERSDKGSGEQERTKEGCLPPSLTRSTDLKNELKKRIQANLTLLKNSIADDVKAELSELERLVQGGNSEDGVRRLLQCEEKLSELLKQKTQ